MEIPRLDGNLAGDSSYPGNLLSGQVSFCRERYSPTAPDTHDTCAPDLALLFKDLAPFLWGRRMRRQKDDEARQGSSDTLFSFSETTSSLARKKNKRDPIHIYWLEVNPTRQYRKNRRHSSLTRHLQPTQATQRTPISQSDKHGIIRGSNGIIPIILRRHHAL